MKVRNLIATVVVLTTVLTGATGRAQAGGTGTALAAGTAAPLCVTQPAGARVPGVILKSDVLDGVLVDDATGHTFAVAGGQYDTHNRYVCSNGLLMLDTAGGRVLNRIVLGHGTGLDANGTMALHLASHRLLVSSGDPSSFPPHVQSPGLLNIVDTRSGRLLKSVPVGTHAAGMVVVDQHTYRAFVRTDDPQQGVGFLAVVAITRGTVLRQFRLPVDDLAVDQHTNRVFVIGNASVTTLDGATGDVLNTAPLPSNFQQYSGYGVDERTGRLFISQIGLAAPHSGLNANPPSTLTMVDTQTGAVLKVISEAPGVLVSRVIVDQLAGVALSWVSNSRSVRATIIDAGTGAIRRNASLALPPGGFNGPFPRTPIAVDPQNGNVYGFTSQGIRMLQPGRWGTPHVITRETVLEGYQLALGDRSHRLYALEMPAPPDQAQRLRLRAICTVARCR